jgi:hypothetical protein
MMGKEPPARSPAVYIVILEETSDSATQSIAAAVDFENRF